MTEPTPVAPDEGRRRLLVLVVGGVALLVLLLLVLRLVAGGGDETPTAPTAPPTRPPGGAATTTTTSAGPGSRESFEVFTTKNPFLPLRSPGGGAPPPGAGAAPTGGATTGGSGATGATTGAGAATGARGGREGGTEPRRGARFALLDVFAEGGRTMANVRVNDTVHKVSAGQAFATNFKVVSLSQSDRCGRFLFGDESFRLCKGEEVLK